MIALVRTVTSVAFDLFYRRRMLGREVPARGPVLLLANHPNGLVDPVAVMLATRRPVRFLAKAPLFEMPVLGRIVRAMGALPVYRRVDAADTARNESTFDAVHDALGRGDVVCLFPEGVSHSEPSLQELRTGAARMALGTEARAAYRVGVRIVPVGLLYGRKGRYRSRMGIWIGEAIEMDDLLALHRTDEREAVRVLTERIAEGLRSVTVELDGWEDLPLVELAERIWPADHEEPYRVQRGFAQGLRRLRRSDPARAERLRARVADFRDRLEGVGLAPEDLDRSYTASGVARFAARTAARLLVLLPLTLLGALVWFVPFRLLVLASRVRRVSPDLVATQKLLAALLILPLWWAGLALAAGAWLSLGAALLAALATPLLGVVTIRFGDRLRAVRRDIAAFLRSGAAESLKERLRARREELLAEFQAVQRSWSDGGDASAERS